MVCGVACCSHIQSALAVLVLPTLRRCLIDLNCLIIPIQTDEASFYLIEDCSGWPHKGALDVLLTLGRSLNIEHFIVPGQFECVVSGHHTLLRQISLVSH